MILDTSALLAILFKEEEATEFLHLVANAPEVRMSAANMLEAWMVVDRHSDKQLPDQCERIVGKLQVNIVPVSPGQVRVAREAYLKFGKGRHRAGLNFGDCFAYALAKCEKQRLLFKGNDFGLTDIDRAR
jgi:ribonuclease VapC